MKETREAFMEGFVYGILCGIALVFVLWPIALFVKWYYNPG